MTFRIIPRQVNTRPDERHTRFGFFIYGHPKGDQENGGAYLASYEDMNTAFLAAFCVGVDPNLVNSLTWMPYIEPKEEDWRSIDDDPPEWRDVGKWVEFQKDGDPMTRWRGELEAEAWFTGEEEIPICKVRERSIHDDFTHWRIIHHES